MKLITIDDGEFQITKGLVRTMALRNKFIDDIGNPDIIVDKCIQNDIPADILTFSQLLPDFSPKFNYRMEWDNIAAVPVSSYENWLMKQIHPNTRNKIKKAERNGVVVKVESLSRKISEGLVEIFNETMVRRGKKNFYYGRDVETVEKEWSRDSGRNDFLIAYYKDEIIGFIQLVYADKYARTSGTVAKLSHRNKSPMNALLAKAVEICEKKKIEYLIYGQFVYGNKGEDSLTSFKKNNGFQRFDVPQYFIPLSLRGKLGLCLSLHHGIFVLLPSRAQRLLAKIRFLWYNKYIGLSTLVQSR